MLIILFAFLSSLFFGFSDFIGGVASRSARVIAISAVSYVTASAAYAIALLFVPSEWSIESLTYGAASGLAALLGFVGFYAALASGPIAIMSPAIALLQTILPVIVGVVLYNEGIGSFGWVGIGLALVGAWLMGGASRSTGRIPRRSIVLGLLAGSMFALSLIILDASPAHSGLTPGFVEMVVGLVGLMAIWWASSKVPFLGRVTDLLDVDGNASRASTALTRHTTTLALTAGLLMGTANVFALVSLRGGQLAIVSAVVALYPLGTVLLARIVLKERLAPAQWVGIGCAITACVALSL